MRLLNSFFLLTLMSFPMLSPAQDKDEELLAWSATKKLAWSDYKGKPDTGSDAAATTSTYLGFEYAIRNNKFSYQIDCMFSKNKSWGRAKTEYILSHEQGHFDIAEIFARKLNKKMTEYLYNKKNYREELDKIYNDIIEEKEIFQTEYDKVTDYSRNMDIQAVWLKKIEGLLKEFKNYSVYN